MGWTHLRSQITAQDKRNVNLNASNASLRKSNAELASQLEELRSRNEELSSNHVSLVEENAKMISQLDDLKEELVKEKTMSADLKSELEMAALKVQTIAVDAMLSARAELMTEFKMGKHSSWNPDEEIQTWEKRAAVLAGGEVFDDEEEMSAPVVGSLKQVELAVGHEQVEPDEGAKDAAVGSREKSTSHEDITTD